jgi:hypothetical protein
VSSRSEQLQELRRVVRSEQLLWAWADDQGISPWEDRHGRILLPLWMSEARATEENQRDAEPGEKAVPYAVSILLEKLDGWEEAGVGAIGLEPRDGAILYSLTPAEFRDFLAGGTERRLP